MTIHFGDNTSITSGGSLGKVLQCKTDYVNDMVTVTNPAGNQNSLYGLGGYRVYGDLNTITITPVSSSSTMIVQGISGCTNSPTAYPSTGAYGIVCVKDNSSGFDNTNYNAYQLSNLMGSYGYLPFVSVQHHHAAGNTNQQTWYLKGYAYTEGTNECKIRYINHHLIVWEVEI